MGGFSHFFILSSRGDVIISRDYRGDAVKATSETFFRHAKKVCLVSLSLCSLFALSQRLFPDGSSRLEHRSLWWMECRIVSTVLEGSILF